MACYQCHVQPIWTALRDNLICASTAISIAIPCELSLLQGALHKILLAPTWLCDTGEVVKAMSLVLLQHGSATSGLLAWQGIMAAASVFVTHRDSTTSAASSKALVPSTAQPATAEPINSAKVAVHDSSEYCADTTEAHAIGSFWSALPAVMAYYTCSTDGAAPVASPDATQPTSQPHSNSYQQFRPVPQLVKADASLLQPFVEALVKHCKQTAGHSEMDHATQQASSSVCQAAVKQTESSRSTPQQPAEPGGSAQKSAVIAGGRLVAAAGMLLALCEEQPLLAQVLACLQSLTQACSQLRCVCAQ